MKEPRPLMFRRFTHLRSSPMKKLQWLKERPRLWDQDQVVVARLMREEGLYSPNTGISDVQFAVGRMLKFLKTGEIPPGADGRWIKLLAEGRIRE